MPLKKINYGMQVHIYTNINTIHEENGYIGLHTDKTRKM